MASFYNFLRYLLRFALFFISNIYCIFGYILWLTILTPLRISIPNVYWKIERELFYWLNTVCTSWITTGGYKVIECGDDIDSLQDQESLLLCNHQSTGDVPLVMLALNNKKIAASRVMWVIYRPYKYTNFGFICIHRDDFFIDVGKEVRTNELSRFRTHLVGSYLNAKKKWIAVFPEGGFLCRGKEAGLRYARRNNLPELEHVQLPRVGAVKTVLDSVGEPYVDAAGTNGQVSESSESTDPSRPVKWVIDMTIAYKDKQPLELLGMSIGYDPRRDILLHWKAYRVKDIPRDEASLTSWLYQRYIEKEEMLDAYYKEGKLPGPSENSPFPPKKTRYLRFDGMYQLLVHAALFVLCYLQYFIIFKPTAALFSFAWNSVFQ